MSGDSKKDKKTNPEKSSADDLGARKAKVALAEETVLAFWQENDIFQKTLDKDAPNGDFVFYDGPPFATGLPHYGHLLAGTIKDVIPRYKTMQGYHVPRRWGWDCHGLPIENLIEKELGLSTKKEIEELGIDKFNEAARANVLRYDEEWKKVVPRTGRFIDMENAYVSMDPKYTESVWWAFGQLHAKGLVNKNFKSMHLCPRCETTLANFEVNQGYMDVKDISVTAKLTLKGEENVHLLAWTTTPWTLPGNMAAAVGSDIEYVKFSLTDEAHAGQFYVVAKERLEDVVAEAGVTLDQIHDTLPGSALVGKEYHPPFSYYLDQDIDNKDNAWKVYAADYVTTEDGTGIVHLAPAFGSEDLDLAQTKGIPVVHHVLKNGAFAPEVTDFAGMLVKQKDVHMDTDIEIIKHLAGIGKLFAKKKLVHSYPHCWRCDTPLLNYATTSWFVDVPAIKDRLIANNQNISWVPEHIRDGRFGKWLEGAREWAVSRSRYWGAVLPVWVSEDGETEVVIDSYEKLRRHTKTSGNTYRIMRHGEAESNVNKILTSNIATEDHMTDRGIDQVMQAAQELKGQGIDLIIHSPFHRTTQTAKVVQDVLGLSDDQMMADDRIVEMDFGSFDGQPYHVHHAKSDEVYEFETSAGDGETLNQVRQRMGAFLYDLESQFQGKNILIISHGTPLWLLDGLSQGKTESELLVMGGFGNAEVRQLDFVPLPHNAHYEFDVHRPYIDQLPVVGESGQSLQLIGEVFDVWFESGSMPYGQLHYPFKNKELFESSRFPAQFIAEGTDQTRGWFYVMAVLGTALFDQIPYQNVIVNGMVLAEDGKKMSKRLRNYPDVGMVFDTYGADAMRLTLVASPVVRAEDLSLSEKIIAETASKVMGRLRNVASLYRMFSDGSEAGKNAADSPAILDQWILARVRQTTHEMTQALDSYQLDRGGRLIFGLIDDLSTWYARRSRDRVKSDDAADKAWALATFKEVLRTTAQIMAPYTPFVAEELWQELRGDTDVESVHLSQWPQTGGLDGRELGLLADMQVVREIISQGLEARASAKMNVRQPLAAATVQMLPGEAADQQQYMDLIAAELNVKTVTTNDKATDAISLDLELTPELRSEGQARALVRHIQSMRKKAGLTPDQQITLQIQADAAGLAVVTTWHDDIAKTVGASTIDLVDAVDADPVTIEGIEWKVALSTL